MGKTFHKTIEGKYYALTYIEGMIAVFTDKELERAWNRAEKFNVI